MPQPWERQDGESASAYAAFLVYRNLGPDRTLLAACRHFRSAREAPEGTSEARQAGGIWKKWSSVHRWVERATAWDDRKEAHRQRGMDAVAVSHGATWECRRAEQAEKDWEASRKLYAKAMTLVRFPVVERKAERDGAVILIAPIDPKSLRQAASILKDASDLAWNAIADALPDPDADFDPIKATPEELRAFVERKARRGQGPIGAPGAGRG